MAEHSKIQISKQFSIPVVRKSKQFDLAHKIVSDVFPVQVVIRYVPIFHGKQSSPQNSQGFNP